MRFYYVSIFSVIFLGLIYAVGTALLVGMWYALRRWKHAWMLMLPMFVLLYVGPVAEELWISWKFGQLCKKNAGIFVYKTVKVEGFYDDTRPTHDGLPTPQAVESFDRSGYRFYELKFRNTKKIVHIEKVNGQWAPTVLDHPRARYRYETLASHKLVSHRIRKFEDVVIDSQTGEVLGKYLDYARGAPWFFIHLDRPTMFCREVEDDARARGTMFGPRMVLLPME